MDFEEYLPIKEFARKLGVHVQTVRRWIYSGNIPPDLVIKINGKWFIHRDVLNIKLKENSVKSLFSLPPVNPKKLFWVYGDLSKGLSISSIAKDLKMSEKRIYEYIRFLDRIGLIKKRNGSYIVVKDFHEFTDFIIWISCKLRELYSDLLSAIEECPLNYDALAGKLAKKGYNVSPTKIRNIISILKNFRLLVPLKRVAIIEGNSLEEKILNFVKAKGGLVEFGEIVKYFGRNSTVNQAIINLVKNGLIRVRTIPREFVIIAKAMMRVHGRDQKEIYLPIRSVVELKKLVKAISEITGKNLEYSEKIVKMAVRVRPDLLSITRDRPRPEYGEAEPPELVSMAGPLHEKDVIEVLEV
ncbi:MAG: helix-turn-helix domain-containing protein [Candidatus Baldrarchaeia archaeon]